MRVPSARAEEARARLIELCPEGFEEIEHADAVEFAAYVGPDGEQQLARAFGNVSAEDVEPGWEDRWREFHRALRVGHLWVAPPWDESPADAIRVVIDPGRAFGTGAHPTTRLCLELIQRVEVGSCLDVGSGSGVIAVAAAKLGFDPVVAVDVDEHAVDATLRNATANGVAVQAFRTDACAADLPAADVAVANLTFDLVERIVPRLDCRSAITAGYLETDEVDVPGFKHVERLVEEGWVADLLERAQ